MCKRRWGISVIALLLVAVFLAHFLSLAFPVLRNWYMPRFGPVATLSLFPLVFLAPYLRRPSPAPLKGAAFMLFAIAALSAAKLAWTGTVPVVSNAFNDRLPSAYFWSVLAILAMGAYVGWVAWACRLHIAMESGSAHDRG